MYYFFCLCFNSENISDDEHDNVEDIRSDMIPTRLSLLEYQLSQRMFFASVKEQKAHNPNAQHVWDKRNGLIPYQTPEQVLGLRR
jgi:hypothetical protein